MRTQTAADHLLAVARAEIGYLEKASNSQLEDKTANAGSNNYTKYARDLDKLGVYNGKKNGFAWCDMFVDWCFIRAFGLETGMTMTFQPMGGYGAGCTNSAKYYQQQGRYYADPQPGDQIFFSENNGKTMCHTGLVEKVANGRVYTIEGNTSGSSGVVANGGMVRSKSYPLGYTKIVGYGRPDYSLATDMIGDDNMDAADFDKLFAEYRKQLQDNDCSTYSAEARQWALDSGIISGGEPLPDGRPNYMWGDFLTREQLVTILYRFYLLIAHKQH